MATRLGQLIRDARHRSGLRLEDLAATVGVTAGALSHIESGRRLPNPSNAVAIADALGVPREDVLLALDEEHSSRRRISAESGASGNAGPSRPTRFQPDAMRMYSSMPISALFEEPDGAVFARGALTNMSVPLASSPSLSRRDTARWSEDTAERIAALEQLADSAAEAIRTLRGLAEDEDPAVSREARRLLRELDVRSPEE